MASIEPKETPARTADRTTLRLRKQVPRSVRVRLAGEWDSRLGEDVRGLLARCGPAVPVDLLLDMGAVFADRPDAGKEALRALDALMPLADWRSAALLGGGFPRVTADMLEQGTWDEPRADWHMWHEVRASERAYAPRLRYGDYGTQSVAALAQVPVTGRKGGPPWGVLSYTTENSYLLFKMLTRGPDRIAVNRSAARQVTELPEFREAGGGQGEAWLSSCAHGPSWTGAGAGGPSEWLRVGNLQHMTYVVHSLPGA
ncbi:beta family protein [Streptomyces bauhiniae]|uniref:beta family protein n=1 Tax=Streptomyces bauhiniae TaxID=2340725 RepID=UPI003455DA6F